ncbi:hypothetical protein [Mycolicibacterium fortuitum]|uniref:hypothetical protein n=1 Tax=Mycolicibacterium fortuitum TaxID=1766 RepID=UPI0026376354|nr:hypothetical protein [Mycolicibacterium fortuitum]
MVQWIKDWAPILATIGTLFGVMITVGSASRTYKHGLIEKRKDRQRELLASLIADTQQLCYVLGGVVYPAMAKMSQNDMLEYASTETAILMGDLNKSVRIGLIKGLSEIGDRRIQPLLAELELQRNGLGEGEDVAPVFDPAENEGRRFTALGVLLQRVGRMRQTNSRLQVAVIQSLPVEIQPERVRRRLWDWLRGTHIAWDGTIAKHY